MSRPLRYTVFRSESVDVDVDGPPSWFVLDTDPDVDDVVAYFDTRDEALCEANWLNAGGSYP